MIVDRSSEPYSVTFERVANPKPGQAHEVVDDDRPGELVREFLLHAHRVPREQRRTRISQADRDAAKEWLNMYGLEKAKWMIERCAKMQRERHAAPILVFRGLQLYENAAAGAYERSQHDQAAERGRRLADEIDHLWSLYQRRLVDLFDSKASAEERARLELETREQLRRDMGDKPAYIVEAHLRGRVCEEKRGQMNPLAEADFRASPTVASLREALIARHGVDVLSPSSPMANGLLRDSRTRQRSTTAATPRHETPKVLEIRTILW
jgi:hypothetical protein